MTSLFRFFKKNKLKFVSKKTDFKIFCQIMELINNGRHLSDSGLRKIIFLKKHMH